MDVKRFFRIRRAQDDAAKKAADGNVQEKQSELMDTNKEEGKKVTESKITRATGSTEIKPKVTIDCSKIEQDFVEKYCGLCTAMHSLKDTIHLYEKTIEDSHTSTNDKDGLIAFIALITSDVCEFISESDVAEFDILYFEQDVLATLYILSCKYNFSFFEMFDALYECSSDEDTAFWSFDSFATIEVLAREYEDNVFYSCVDTKIAQIWRKYFFDFLLKAEDDDIHYLAINTYENWGEFVYQKLTESDAENIFMEFPVELLIDRIPRAFPELTEVAYTLALLLSLQDCSSETDFMACFRGETLPSEKLPENMSLTLYILRKMAELKQYRSVEFDIIYSADKSIILNSIFTDAYANELNEIIDILVNVFKISNEEIEEEVRRITKNVLHNMNANLMPIIVRLLLNPIAFNVINEYNPYLIDAFDAFECTEAKYLKGLPQQENQNFT